MCDKKEDDLTKCKTALPKNEDDQKQRQPKNEDDPKTKEKIRG